MAKNAPFTPAPVSVGEQQVPQAPVAPVAPVQAAPAPPPKAPPKPKKVAPSTENKVVGAKIIIQYRGADGAIYEAMTTVDPDEFKVQRYALDIDEKHEKKRDPETKDIIGFEDTGERILTFQLRYHVR